MEQSSGILIWRRKNGKVQVLLGKCGGPIYARRDKGSWNIPKGHVENDENLLDTALREFNEETSLSLAGLETGMFEYLGYAKTSSGKRVHIFSAYKDFGENKENSISIKSNMCKTVWPPKSGRLIDVPELCEARYFDIDEAEEKIFNYQKVFLSRLKKQLEANYDENPFHG